MHRLCLLLAPCLLLAVIAAGTAWLWLTLTRARVLSPGAVIVCTGISVAVALATEAALKHVRRGRHHQRHARSTTTGRKSA